MKKALTIKDALIEDIEYFKSLKTDGLTAGETFTKLVCIAKLPKADLTPNENEASIYLLTTENDALHASNQSLTLEIEEKNAQMRLNSNSALIDLSPANAKKVRALRLLLKKQGKIPNESTEQEFNSRFLNLALDYFILNKYDFLNKD